MRRCCRPTFSHPNSKIHPSLVLELHLMPWRNVTVQLFGKLFCEEPLHTVVRFLKKSCNGGSTNKLFRFNFFFYRCLFEPFRHWHGIFFSRLLVLPKFPGRDSLEGRVGLEIDEASFQGLGTRGVAPRRHRSAKVFRRPFGKCRPALHHRVAQQNRL